MSLDSGVIERANKLRAELPLLIAPTQSDWDAVQMLGEIERLRAHVAELEARERSAFLELAERNATISDLRAALAKRDSGDERDDALHVAICQAVTILNASHATSMYDANRILREALVVYADAILATKEGKKDGL